MAGPTPGPDDIRYFARPAELARWFDRQHGRADQLWVGFHKRATGTPSVSWSEAVDEALRVGWIDGIRRRVDDERYTIRFTPRKPGSVWSAVNVAKVGALEAAGRMTPAGRAAFEARRDDRTAVYSFERQEAAAFDAAQERRFRADTPAWSWWQGQPPGYRRTATHWVVSAKRADTRQRRLETLIADCAAGQRLAQFDWSRGRTR